MVIGGDSPSWEPAEASCPKARVSVLAAPRRGLGLGRPQGGRTGRCLTQGGRGRCHAAGRPQLLRSGATVSETIDRHGGTTADCRHSRCRVTTGKYKGMHAASTRPSISARLATYAPATALLLLLLLEFIGRRPRSTTRAQLPVANW